MPLLSGAVSLFEDASCGTIAEPMRVVVGVLEYGDALPWRWRGGVILHSTFHGGVDSAYQDDGALPMEWIGLHE